MAIFDRFSSNQHVLNTVNRHTAEGTRVCVYSEGNQTSLWLRGGAFWTLSNLQSFFFPQPFNQGWGKGFEWVVRPKVTSPPTYTQTHTPLKPLWLRRPEMYTCSLLFTPYSYKLKTFQSKKKKRRDPKCLHELNCEVLALEWNQTGQDCLFAEI